MGEGGFDTLNLSEKRPGRILGWLVGQWQWPYVALFTGCTLLALAPLWFHVAGGPPGWVYLQLPIYLLHQWEEHAGDRFRIYTNRVVAGSREALTPIATFWINALGVWLVDGVALYLASFIDLSLGLMAVYLPLVNSLGHVGQAVVRREYNPGLWTSLGLFLPAGAWSLYAVSSASGANWKMHVLGVGVAIAVHAAILVHVARRLSRLSAMAAGPTTD